MKNALYVLLGVMAGFVLAGTLVFVSRAPAGEPIILQQTLNNQACQSLAAIFGKSGKRRRQHLAEQRLRLYDDDAVTGRQVLEDLRRSGRPGTGPLRARS